MARTARTPPTGDREPHRTPSGGPAASPAMPRPAPCRSRTRDARGRIPRAAGRARRCRPSAPGSRPESTRPAPVPLAAVRRPGVRGVSRCVLTTNGGDHAWCPPGRGRRGQARRAGTWHQAKPGLRLTPASGVGRPFRHGEMPPNAAAARWPGRSRTPRARAKWVGPTRARMPAVGATSLARAPAPPPGANGGWCSKQPHTRPDRRDVVCTHRAWAPARPVHGSTAVRRHTRAPGGPGARRAARGGTEDRGDARRIPRRPLPGREANDRAGGQEGQRGQGRGSGCEEGACAEGSGRQDAVQGQVGRMRRSPRRPAPAARARGRAPAPWALSPPRRPRPFDLSPQDCGQVDRSVLSPRRGLRASGNQGARKGVWR
jgi:hypothetical protein